LDRKMLLMLDEMPSVRSYLWKTFMITRSISYERLNCRNSCLTIIW
jgi:hypothetical protein